MTRAAWSPEEAERYLLSLELFGMKFGLERMRRLLTTLGNPQLSFDSVHVVGTNGKSSTTRMTAAILERHGIRTGTYTSPHLTSYSERVQVGEQDLAPDEFAAAVQRAARAAELVEAAARGSERVTQFEVLTAAAFTALAHHGVEVAVIEAGLGGRYDATNVIPSRVQVLTSVGLEHTRWLGPTLTHIASEKLAVVQPGATLVLGPGLHADAEAVAVSVAQGAGARIVRAGSDPGVPVGAPGAFQRRNFAVARAAAEAYLGALEPAHLACAAAEVRVPGRMQVIDQRPLTVLDSAHNPDGVRALAESLRELNEGRRVVAVLSILEDKDAAGMLEAILPACEAVVLTASQNPRALPPPTLESLTRQLAGPPAEIVCDPAAALQRARVLAGPDGLVLATGSIYLVADLVRPAGRVRRASML